ncbi:hypothetical protein H4R34_004472 [Dimargaris verticillata]|uniref:RRM domain-containing protein n=1 Tax=Dimargaris verticillata TaxID=2761393 RepID=A0A9W8B041_9FUNG|nr:hypothetical protein H4R34_004472 [Dimargaris verticillata]
MATFAYPEQTQQPAPAAGPVEHPATPKATLWMGDLEPWMDENYLRQTWYNLGEQVDVKMIYNRSTNGPAGYCFLDFPDVTTCNKALATYNGIFIPGTQKLFRLNWANSNGPNAPSNGGAAAAMVVNHGVDNGGPADRVRDFPIFVGDLGSEVNDYMLLSALQARFPSCYAANVKVDTRTGVNRGYGFARFTDEGEFHRALTELSGVQVGSRPIRVSTVTSSGRRHHHGHGYYSAGQPGHFAGGNGGGYPHPHHSGVPVPMGALDPNNTTVFVGGLIQPVTEADLRNHFQSFGLITNVKIPQGKGCAFVQFQQRPSAEMAIAQLNGTQLGASRIRLSWGRGHNHHHSHHAAALAHMSHHLPHGAYGRMNGGPAAAGGYYPQQPMPGPPRGMPYGNPPVGFVQPHDPMQQQHQAMAMDPATAAAMAQGFPQNGDKSVDPMKSEPGFSYGVQA